jgi:hypothetical protein
VRVYDGACDQMMWKTKRRRQTTGERGTTGGVGIKEGLILYGKKEGRNVIRHHTKPFDAFSWETLVRRTEAKAVLNTAALHGITWLHKLGLELFVLVADFNLPAPCAFRLGER